MSASIIYRRLDMSRNEIRLVRLLPDSPADHGDITAVKCTLEYTSLSSPSSYIALSYQWGGSGRQDSYCAWSPVFFSDTQSGKRAAKSSGPWDSTGMGGRNMYQPKRSSRAWGANQSHGYYLLVRRGSFRMAGQRCRRARKGHSHD